MNKFGVLGVIAAVGVFGLAQGPATAQGTMSPMQKPTNGSCPSGWTDYASEARKSGDLSSGKGNTCYPKKTGAKPAYLPSPSSKPCADGYIKSGSFCVQSSGGVVTAPTSGPVKKANALDRCPVGYFTDPGNATICTTKAANPPKVRLKGAGQCNAGELDDWGLYCVSNYENLALKDAPEGTADYNNIYKNSYRAVGKTSRPNQEALPEGVSYTPAYLEIFGRVKRDGSPIGGGAASASASSGAAASNPVAAAKQCAPKPKKKKGLGGLGKAIGAAVGVDIPDGGDGC